MKIRRFMAPLALAAGAGLALAAMRRERRYVLERSQFVEAPLNEVFAFFADPRNLAKLTPPWLGFEITHVDDGPLRPGFRIEYVVRPLRVAQTWVTRIIEVDENQRFVDIQERGPYQYWRHEHTFADAGSGTIVADRVEYSLPFGMAGGAAHSLLVERQLGQIFAFRQRAIDELFPAGRSAAAMAVTPPE
jgi:ligand-binding SRPBCC domain-containing protein